MGGLLPSGLNVNKTGLSVLVGFFIVVFLSYRYYYQMDPVEEAAKKLGDMMDVGRLDSPPELTEDVIKSIEQKTETIDVTLNDKKYPTFTVEEVKKEGTPKMDVLFLHGAKFSHQNWLDIKTLSHVASWGYRAVAIDLPGMKNSKGKDQTLDPTEYGPFLGAYITAKKLQNVVIVTPSASGRNALPYLFKDGATSTDRAKALVTIAPVSTQEFVPEYSKSKLPTLIMYGSKDIGGVSSLNNLKSIPNHKIASIEGADHACYLDKPDTFHKVLFNYFREITAS